jgi:hypothetical protein
LNDWAARGGPGRGDDVAFEEDRRRQRPSVVDNLLVLLPSASRPEVPDGRHPQGRVHKGLPDRDHLDHDAGEARDVDRAGRDDDGHGGGDDDEGAP